MHTDKVFYSNAQIKKADWDLASRNRGEKSAAALLDKWSGKSAERRTANGHRMVRPAQPTSDLRAGATARLRGLPSPGVINPPLMTLFGHTTSNVGFWGQSGQ
jgi:hypothetical protein